jgi:hypothetical protein
MRDIEGSGMWKERKIILSAKAATLSAGYESIYQGNHYMSGFRRDQLPLLASRTEMPAYERRHADHVATSYM